MKDWIVTYVDGKIASVTRDFKAFADIARAVAQMPSSSAPSEMHSGRITTDELLMMATTLRWEDLRLFGTKFQKSVWKQLFDLVHGPEGTYHPPLGLYSYSDFASICSNPGVRSVAHAVALNPVTRRGRRIPCSRGRTCICLTLLTSGSTRPAVQTSSAGSSLPSLGEIIWKLLLSLKL